MAEGGRIIPIMEQGEVCGQAVPEEENSIRKHALPRYPDREILYLSDSYLFPNIITRILQKRFSTDFCPHYFLRFQYVMLEHASSIIEHCPKNQKPRAKNQKPRARSQAPALPVLYEEGHRERQADQKEGRPGGDTNAGELCCTRCVWQAVKNPFFSIDNFPFGLIFFSCLPLPPPT